MEGRKQFTFYRSWYEAIIKLPKGQRGQAFEAICAYALDEAVLPVTAGAATIMVLAKPILDSARKKADGGARSKKKTETSCEDANKTQETSSQDADNKKKNKGKNKNKNQDYSPDSPPPPFGEPDHPVGSDIIRPSGDAPVGADTIRPMDAPNGAPVGAAISRPQDAPHGGSTPVGSSTGRPSNPALASLSPSLAEKAQEWLQYKQERLETYKPTGLQALVSRIQTNAAQYGDAAVIALIDQAMSSNYAGIPWDRLPQQGKSVKVPGGNVDWEHHEPSDWKRDAIRRMMGEQKADSTEPPPEDPTVQAALDSLQGETMVTTAILQRRLKIGYAEAERVMASLESLGAVGPYNGGKPREVLVK